jgi:hypothetical protein
MYAALLLQLQAAAISGILDSFMVGFPPRALGFLYSVMHAVVKVITNKACTLRDDAIRHAHCATMQT